MPHLSFEITRRICSQLGRALLILGLASSAANAGISSGLRDLLQGALGADLRVDSLALNKGQAAIGETLTATVGISNGGKAAATSTLLTLWARFGSSTSTSNAFRLATVRLGTLQPLTRITSVSTFPVPNFGRLGAYQIFATVESTVPEQNRQNNTQAKRLMVIGPAFSDTDSEPGSDPGGSSAPAPAPVADGGSSSPPASGSSGSSTPSAPTSGSDSGSGSSGSGSSSPSGSSSDSGPPPAPIPTPPSFTCDYYASPNGRGNGTTPQTPFLIQSFWAVATPGTTLCLLDGHYIGGANIIAPQAQGRPEAVPSGTPTNKITIRCLNEGQCLIDAQFVAGRSAIRFNGNTDIEVIGVNACCSGATVPVIYARRAKRVSFRRVIAWDQHRPTDVIVQASSVLSADGAGTQDILFEDCAAFGMGQRMARNAFKSVRATFRRCWFRQEGDVGGEPTSIFNLWRDSGDVLVENTLFTLDGSRGGSSQFSGLAITGGGLGCGDSGGVCAPATARLLGSILYLKSGCCTSSGLPPFGLRWWSLADGHWSANDTGTAILNHFVAYAPNHTLKLIDINDQNANLSGSANNITTIKHPSASSSSFSTFTGTNRREGTSVGAVPNIFTGVNAANICKRYVNGVLTNDSLWPWPMDQRIKEAIDRATAMQANPKSPLLISNSVTGEIEDMFGGIPSQCRSR